MTILLAAMATVSAADDVSIGGGSNTGSSLPLKTETTTSSSIVTQLDKSPATVADVANGDGSNASSSLLLSTEATNSSSVATQIKSAAAADNIAIGVGCTTGSGLRLRSEASTTSSVVTQMEKSVAVAILGKQDGWYYVSYDGKSGYVSADYVIEDQDGVFATKGRVNGDSVNVRASAAADAESVATVDGGSFVTVNGFADGWYAVTCQYGTTGYIRSDFVDLTSAASASTSVSGVVSIAKQYLGTRYTYGGASPGGFDCSGFTMKALNVQNRTVALIENGSWACKSGDLMQKFINDELKNMTVLNERVSMLRLLAALSVAALLSGCGSTAGSSTSSASEDKLLVTATVFPAYDFARAVCGDLAEVKLLLPPGAESHSYEPTPKDILEVEGSDLFVYLGGDSDAW